MRKMVALVALGAGTNLDMVRVWIQPEYVTLVQEHSNGTADVWFADGRSIKVTENAQKLVLRLEE